MIKQSYKSIRGISLMELAIVLGIIGFVIAAIWMAASTVRQRERIHDSVQIINDIAGRVRSIYTGFPNAVVPGPADISGQIAQDFFPESIINTATNTTVTPWGGTYAVRFKGGGSAGVGFSIEVTMDTSIDVDVRKDACINLLTRILGSATNYTGGTSGTLPAGVVPRRVTQGMGPALTFVKKAAWSETTTSTVLNISQTIDGGNGCEGVAFYYKL